jgi:tetratricopeptide (TPR) repeat protein
MAPEQFDNFAGCDERSDIYSFGIVLYQMAAGGQLPFLAPMGEDFCQAMQRLHSESPVPRLDSPLFPIIQRCLEKSPERRYQTFNEARSNLESLLQHETGEVISPPQSKELEAGEWTNKGASLGNLGRNEEAIRCFDKAIELDPQDARAWNNKGNCLRLLGRHEEAIRCFDKAIELDPQDAAAWMNKGTALGSLDRLDEAIYCFDKALELDPRFVEVWGNRGTTLDGLGRHEEAICCYDRVLQLDQLYADALIIKALAEEKIGQFREASCCYHQFLALATARDVERIEYAHKRLRELGGK